MTVFLSSYTNSVDKKGRVSVPASFRAEMAPHSRQTVVAFAAPKEGFIYAWSYDDFVIFAEKIKALPPMSATRQRLARTILAAARPLGFDSEGRIMIPEELLAGSDINGKALFAGQGDYFTIWNPDKYQDKLATDEDNFTEDMALLESDWDAI